MSAYCLSLYRLFASPVRPGTGVSLNSLSAERFMGLAVRLSTFYRSKHVMHLPLGKDRRIAGTFSSVANF